jgi:hypothetical protein
VLSTLHMAVGILYGIYFLTYISDFIFLKHDPGRAGFLLPFLSRM